MRFGDMHIHGRFSDGREEPAEFVKNAIAAGMDYIGLSDHSPIPKPNTWSMKIEDLEEYIACISALKEEYKNNINIYLGLELDYIPGMDIKGYIGFEKLPLDYFLGSVHYVYAPGMGKNKTVDASPEKFEKLIEEGFGGDARELYKAYYKNVRQMIEVYRPEMIAHVDLITKFNSGGRFFDTGDQEYIKEVDRTLNAAKEYGSIIELNSGGMSRGYMDSPYPSEYILKKCLEMNIPVTLNSDAHSPENLSYEFKTMSGNIKSLGFTEIMLFSDGNWVPAKL